ncbi:hypothetical protein ACFQ0O_21865 [Saccharopolyspora spinosporotrichia]
MLGAVDEAGDDHGFSSGGFDPAVHVAAQQPCERGVLGVVGDVGDVVPPHGTHFAAAVGVDEAAFVELERLAAAGQRQPSLPAAQEQQADTGAEAHARHDVVARDRVRVCGDRQHHEENGGD